MALARWYQVNNIAWKYAFQYVLNRWWRDPVTLAVDRVCVSVCWLQLWFIARIVWSSSLGKNQSKSLGKTRGKLGRLKLYCTLLKPLESQVECHLKWLVSFSTIFLKPLAISSGYWDELNCIMGKPVDMFASELPWCKVERTGPSVQVSISLKHKWMSHGLSR